MKPRRYKPPDVSSTFFAYASGLDRDRLLDLRLTRFNTRANLRGRLGELLADYFDAIAEIRLCNWLLKNGEPAVCDADAALLRSMGIRPDRIAKEVRRGQPHRHHPRVAHAA